MFGKRLVVLTEHLFIIELDSLVILQTVGRSRRNLGYWLGNERQHANDTNGDGYGNLELSTYWVKNEREK